MIGRSAEIQKVIRKKQKAGMIYSRFAFYAILLVRIIQPAYSFPALRYLFNSKPA